MPAADHRSMSRQRTRAPNRKPFVIDGDLVKSGKPPQIDQHARRRQTEGENRHQALPAGDHGRVGIRCEKSDRFRESRGSLVVEGCGFQCQFP